MPKPRRLRRIAKWIGLSACVLLMVLWAFSLQYVAYLKITQSVLLDLQNGTVQLSISDGIRPFYDKGFHFVANGWDGIKLELPSIQRSYPVNWGIGNVLCLDIDLPIWFLMLISAAPTALLFHRDRRRIPPGHCRQCGYDLTANTSGRCPECGRPTDPAPLPASNPTAPRGQ